MIALVASICGAFLVTLPGYRYRIDVVRCDAWPGILEYWPLWIGYLAGVALLACAWLRLSDGERPGRWSLRATLCLGALPHLVAATGPMFLSEDPLAYAANGADAFFVPHHPFYQALQPAWRNVASVYSIGFDGLAHLVALGGGQHLTRTLHLYQVLGAACMITTGWLVGLTSGPRAAALVLFCPLAIIEGTLSAHNDGLLAISVALAVLLWSRDRRIWAMVALCSGLFIKESAIILPSLWALSWLIARIGWKRAVMVLVPVTIVLGLLVLTHRISATTSALLGGRELCIRAIECLPRATFYYLLDAPKAALAVNLLFRSLAAAFLFYSAYRARTQNARLSSTAAFLLYYYLFLHPYVQAWYLLSLLPFLPHLEPRLLKVAKTFLISLVSYYVVDIPFGCTPATHRLTWALVQLTTSVIVVVPAVIVLLKQRRPT